MSQCFAGGPLFNDFLFIQKTEAVLTLPINAGFPQEKIKSLSIVFILSYKISLQNEDWLWYLPARYSKYYGSINFHMSTQ